MGAAPPQLKSCRVPVPSQGQEAAQGPSFALIWRRRGGTRPSPVGGGVGKQAVYTPCQCLCGLTAGASWPPLQDVPPRPISCSTARQAGTVRQAQSQQANPAN